MADAVPTETLTTNSQRSTAGTLSRWMFTHGRTILRSKPYVIGCMMKLVCQRWNLKEIASPSGR